MVVVPVFPGWLVQLLQVLTVLVLAPLITGVIARAEAIVHQRQGPRLGAAGFAISIAAIDSGSPYAQLGSSRLRTSTRCTSPR